MAGHTPDLIMYLILSKGITSCFKICNEVWESCTRSEERRVKLPDIWFIKLKRHGFLCNRESQTLGRMQNGVGTEVRNAVKNAETQLSSTIETYITL